jgi:hypothetical protein
MSATFTSTHGGRCASCAERGATRLSLWNYLQNALRQAHARRFEREAAAYIQAHGGRFTDQLERRILDRATGLDRLGPDF